MDRTARRIFVAWLSYGLIAGLTTRLALEHFWLVGFAPLLAWVLAGLAIFVWNVRQLLEPDLRRPAGRNLAAMVVGAGLGASARRRTADCLVSRAVLSF